MSTTMTYGPIAMVPKGDWVSGTSYVKLNLVRYQGATWICTAATNSVAPPSDPSTTTSNSYWMLLNKDLNYNNTIYDLAVDSSDNILKYKKSSDNSTVSTGLKFSNSTTNSDNISSSSLKVIPATDTTGKLPYNFIPEATISGTTSTLGGVVKAATISDSSDNTTVPTSLAVKNMFTNTNNTYLKEAIRDLVYPVGSIYTSTVNTSPASFLGGTWESIGGKFLLSANSTYTAGNTGGSATHTLTTAEMPSHNHSVSIDSSGSHTHTFSGSSASGSFTVGSSDYATTTASGCFSTGDAAAYGDDNNGKSYRATINMNIDLSGSIGSAGSHTHSASIGSVGSGTAFSTLPPYLVVYMWKRTA